MVSQSKLLRVIFVIAISIRSLPGQAPNNITSIDARILTEIHDHNHLMANAEHFSDVIGSRLTGSQQQRAASDWAEQVFRQYGLVNVHQEKWNIAHAWTRGSAEASITAPVSRRVEIASVAWSPGTDGYELAKVSAILVDDTGTGPIVAIGAHENYQDVGALQDILAPVSQQLHLLEPKLSRTFGSDYAAFNEAGIPGFSCIGDSPNYYLTHHSQADTFDKVSEAGLIQSAQFVAAWAFNTAEYPTLLPRKLGK